MKRRITVRIEQGIFSHRGTVLIVFGAITVLMAYYAAQLKIDAGFEKLLPLYHPYMKTFKQHMDEFGGANRLLIAVRAKKGDIFTPAIFQTIKAVTDEVFFIPGVNRSTVQSIFTPNVRFIEIVEGGFSGGNVIPADFTPTEENLARVRENILKAGIVGRLVANDFTAAMVSAQLTEVDPATGGKLDYLSVARQLEEKIRSQYENENVSIHIIGFAKMIGDIAKGAKSVVAFFGVTIIITFVLVYFFTHSRRMTFMALLCSLTAVLWDMGLLSMLGFGIDPMSILIPFLVFAIGVSHSVQMINATATEIQKGRDSVEAARATFRSLLLPGGIALLTDTIGFLTILFINIRMIRELALTAGLGVLLIILTNLVLLPVLLSYLRFGDTYRERRARGVQRREPIWKTLCLVTDKSKATTIVSVAVVLLGIGIYLAPRIPIGDLQAGVPELRPTSRYNQDVDVITSSFAIGIDVLTTIVETIPNGCIDYEVMTEIDRLAWHVSNVKGVQSTLSLPQVAKIIGAGWNEGSLKWRALPRNPQTMVQTVSPVDTSSGLLNRDCSVMPIIAFLEDHKADTIQRVVQEVKQFAAQHDSERHKFRLATGNAGVMAATNEVVSQTQGPIVAWVYAAVIVLCLLAFRSARVMLCIIAPLCLVSVLCYALMTLLQIGLKVNTLPVASLGVGIGVDYGIYIFSRMLSHLRSGMPLQNAFLETLRVTGSAVLVTGLTLSIGVSTWAFSAIKFQADMGILLSFMFLANMLGAMLLLPALATFLVSGSTQVAQH